MMNIASVQDLEKLAAKGLSSLFPDRIKIMVGSATCGMATGANDVFEALKAALTRTQVQALVKKTGCIGLCHCEPLVDVIIPGKPRLTYGPITPARVSPFIDALKRDRVPEGAIAKMVSEDFLLDDSSKSFAKAPLSQSLAAISDFSTLPFYQKQKKITLRNCGFIDPEDISEYTAKGGYFALARTLTDFTPGKVLNQVERSGLRGRGGAGFLTGLKWKICQNTPGPEKYIICNADEGDPGAYMDRSIIEGDPHAVIEGMLIAGYAIGANKGYCYLRDEYPLALERLQKALDQAAACGLLGHNILNTGFAFDIVIIRGAGAFVCGEETALIKSIEGDWGEPKQRPPYPAQNGLRGKPTVINNVETLATVPVIMAKGAKWFAGMGTRKCKGTKVFSLVGKVNNIGLVEVPMGITLREIIYDIGGGIPNNKAFKAVQTGGPSGGCIPRELIDLPVDYEALTQAGSIMGSGGLIVMDENTCMVDVAKYFLSFLEDESCGKCTPCRVGVRRMREIVADISSGKGSIEDLTLLVRMARLIGESALCGLGRTAPNPVLTTLKYFKDEYLAHILVKRCPAGVCKALISYAIDEHLCSGCGACVKACPADAVIGEQSKPHRIIAEKCITCGACHEVCPVGAVIT